MTSPLKRRLMFRNLPFCESAVVPGDSTHLTQIVRLELAGDLRALRQLAKSSHLVLRLAPLVATTNVGIANTLNKDGGLGIELFSLSNRFRLRQGSLRRPLCTAAPHSIIALWPTLDVKLVLFRHS